VKCEIGINWTGFAPETTNSDSASIANLMLTTNSDSASIANLMLTTEAMVSEIPEKKEANHGAAHGGGMDGMY